MTGRDRQVSLDGEQRVLVGDGGDVVAIPRDVVIDMLGSMRCGRGVRRWCDFIRTGRPPERC